MSLSPPQEKKELILGYALWCLAVVGICGVQRLYLGQVGYGLAMLATFGFCGVGQLLDLLLLPEAVKEANREVNEPTTTPVTQPAKQPASQPAKQPPRSSKQEWDPELEKLLRDAKQSVNRTENAKEDQ